MRLTRFTFLRDARVIVIKPQQTGKNSLRLRSTFLALILTLSSLSLTGATYYISPNGSDATGTGTSANPWKSLYKACKSVKTAGNIIHINAGTYIETLQCNLSVGVSIEGEGAKSVIKSHYKGGDDRNISLIMLADGINKGQHISNIKLDGDNLTGYRAITVYNRSNVHLHDCTIVDFLWQGVMFKGGSQKGNKVYANTITNSGGFQNGDEDACLTISDNTGMLVYNNIINQTGRANGQNGIGLHSWGKLFGCKIYNNKITGLEQDKFQTNWPFAVEFYCSTAPQGYGTEMYGNKIIGEVDFGSSVTKGRYAFGVDFHDNILGDDIIHEVDVLRSGIQFEREVSHVIIRNNIFKNLERPIYFCAQKATDYFEDIFIYGNVITNIPAGYSVHMTPRGYTSHGTAIDFGGNTRPAYVNNIKIYNNTIVAYPSRPAECGIYLPTANNVTNIDIRNNIFVGFARAAIMAERQNASGGTLDGLTLMKNIYFKNGNNNVLKTIDFTPTSVKDDFGIIANPKFVSSTDFHLQKTSPAIRKGVPVGLAKDKHGIPWKNPPSIGAFEYTGGK